MADSGLDVRIVRGEALDDADWAAMAAFYRDNCFAHGSHPYLRPALFDRLRETFSHRVVACMAYDAGTPCAASINFQKGAHLYGRYWGCAASHEFLHFELCYYRLIENAIDHGLRHFEAGAQGFHKLCRGLIPAEVHSAHWIREPALSRAVTRFLPGEAMQVKREIAMLNERSPFRRA